MIRQVIAAVIVLTPLGTAVDSAVECKAELPGRPDGALVVAHR